MLPALPSLSFLLALLPLSGWVRKHARLIKRGKLSKRSGRREMRKIECEPGKLSNISGRGKDGCLFFVSYNRVIRLLRITPPEETQR